MKLIVIGAEGTVGSAACNELAARHEIIKVGRNSGEVQADIADRDAYRLEHNRPYWPPIIIFAAILAAVTIPAILIAIRHFREG